MSPRAIRRAAERQTLQLVANAGRVELAQNAPVGRPETIRATAAMSGADPSASADFTPPISEARLLANRANAQWSTGPRTEEGKAKSSLNAVKTGLTGRTALLSADDAAVYQQHLDRHFTKYSPANDDEHNLVQSIADTAWRLLRIAPLEAGVYALGHRKLAGQFIEEKDPAGREAMIMAEVFLVYRKDLANLALQERRLRSQHRADIAELDRLQQQRADKAKEAGKKRKEELLRALEIARKHRIHGVEFVPEAHGFDFSFEELEAYAKESSDHFTLTETELAFDWWLAAHRAAQKERKAA